MKTNAVGTLIGFLFLVATLVSLPVFADAPWRLVERDAPLAYSCSPAFESAVGQGQKAAGTEEEEEEEEEEDEYEEPDCD